MRSVILSAAILSTLAFANPSHAQQDDPPAAPVAPAAPAVPPASPLNVEAVVMPVEAAITAVTLYPGRAAVTRTAALNLQPGAYDLRFTDLPESIQPGTLQARTGGGLKVLSVDFSKEAVADAAATPEIAELDKRIRSLSQALRAMVDQRELIKSQEAFLDGLTIRATADAADAAGTQRIDLDAVKKQMQFIAAERKRLLGERAALDVEQPAVEAQLNAARANRDAAASKAAVARTAIVSVVSPTPFNGEVTLTYLVAAATWEPAYSVRAASDLSGVQIEYDAILAQRTGENWDDVRLTLSTAQPAQAANPPRLEPWYIDILQPDRDRAAPTARAPASVGLQESDGFRRVEEQKSLEGLAADAQISGGGPSVTFELPRAVTIKTDSQRQQRTRIAIIDSSAEFVHVATPLISEAVYLRGDLANSSGYQMLPGNAAIFLGQDYIGPAAIPSTAPAGRFKLHFGIDRAIKVAQRLINKTTESTGLLSGGRRTSYDYRITIDNGSSPSRDLTLELWSRIPVSRNEEIQVQLIDPSAPLAADQHYLAEERPRGLLKWWLHVPASARESNAMIITYGVRIDRAKDIQATPLPE